jgi:hypothetical protein
VLVKCSHKRTIYLFSPLIFIDIAYITAVIFPFWISLQIHKLDSSFFYVVNAGIIINLFFLLKYNTHYYKKISIEIPKTVYKFNTQRRFLLYLFCFILLLSGIYIGVSTEILKGNSVEGLRREAEIGLGFIRDIPTIGIRVILLVLILQYAKSQTRKALILCVICGGVCFLATGHKSSFGIGWFAMICFFNLKYRGFRLYEYIIFYCAMPVGSALLQTIREGSSDITTNIVSFWNYSLMIFEANTIPIVNEIKRTGFVWGQEYYTALVKVIPRFLWKDKPVSFDYYYKELIGYDFEGGGTPIPTIFSLYVNCGPWFIVFYFLWVYFLMKLYLWLCDTNLRYYYRIFILILISSTSIVATIGNLELLILFALVCMYIYKEKYII